MEVRSEEPNRCGERSRDAVRVSRNLQAGIYREPTSEVYLVRDLRQTAKGHSRASLRTWGSRPSL